MTEQLTVWDEISRAVEKVGEADIRRVQRSLSKMLPEEKALGVIHSEGVKKLWALASYYEGESKRLMVESLHKADTEEQAKDQHCRALRFSSLEDLVRELFWIQAKDDIGAWVTSGSVGLRKDWMLVHADERSSIAKYLGSIRIPE